MLQVDSNVSVECGKIGCYAVPGLHSSPFLAVLLSGNSWTVYISGSSKLYCYNNEGNE